MAFACDTNSGSQALVTSFVLPFPFSGSRSVTATVDVVAADVTLPAWWDFKSCRRGSITLLSAPAGSASCDLAQGFSGGAINPYVLGVNGPNTARLVFLTSSSAHDLTADREYIGPVLSVHFDRTLDTPCGGCATGVCLVLEQLAIGSPTFDTPTLFLTEPELPPDSHIATWQAVGITPGGNCQAATPTRTSTWGEIKALYR